MIDTEITVEFFGIPRQRAGRAALTVPAGTLADVLGAIEDACPALGLRQSDGRLAAHYLLSVNGERFIADLECRLEAGTQLLLLSADPGG